MFEFCVACYIGKSHRLPYSLSQTIYFATLKLIYNDLWGPSHIPSSNGSSYYISFVDAYSKFTWIYFLKNKSETFSIFQQFNVEAMLSKIILMMPKTQVKNQESRKFQESNVSDLFLRK